MNSKDKIESINGFKIYENLGMIRRSWRTVLSCKSIIALENYLWGYRIWGTRNYDYESIYNQGDPDFNEFKYWVNNKPNIPLSTGPSFGKILLKKSENDEEKAFNLFFEKLDEFFQLKGKEPYIF